MSYSSVEFYIGDKSISRVESAMVPPVGSYISIRGEAYSVVGITFAVDRADDPIDRRTMRCNVDLRKLP